MFFNYPHNVIFELTNRCNLRCKMCGIWEEPDKKVISLDRFEELLKDKALRKISHIAFTGGEPFLIGNFEEYYRMAREFFPYSHINISTNGYLTQLILKFFHSVGTDRTSVTISYDGKDSHDSIRRVEGSAKRLLETAVRIKQNFPEIKLSLKLTVTNENYGEILSTAVQCKNLEVPFRFKMMEKLNCHHNRFPSDIEGPDYNTAVIDSITDQAKAVLKFGIETNRKYLKRLIRNNSGKNVPCGCSPRTLFIGIDGKVFLCRKRDPIGNIYSQNLNEIWNSEQKNIIVKEMRHCNASAYGLSFINS